MVIQKPQVEEEQTIQWSKGKEQGQAMIYKTLHSKAKDIIPLKIQGELSCKMCN